MSSLKINGGKPLSGEISVLGSKNAVLPCLAASILTDQPSTFHNVPPIADVDIMLQILQGLGAKVERLDTGTVIIDPSNITSDQLPEELVAKLRASILFIGPLLGRIGSVKMRHPGGCIIGRRPVGTHFQAIHDLGGEITADEENYIASFKERSNDFIFLDEASVTATENILCLAAATPGTTTILGAACEPHVRNLAEYLQAMGAKITGTGTNRITVEGSDKLHGAEHTICPDYIETATFAIMAAATQSSLTIHNALPEDFHIVGLYLRHFGVEYQFVDNQTLQIIPSKLHAPTQLKEVQTRPWPGFPTDALSPLVVLATQAANTTLFHEWMYEGRLLFADKLVAMGAKVITCDPHRILVTGPTTLRGKQLNSPDIRAGIALVIAGLIAQGQTTINQSELIYRGYANLAQRLSAIGADIIEQD